jgi:hypothetical protein
VRTPPIGGWKHGCILGGVLCECECCERLSKDLCDAMAALTLERERGDKWFFAWLHEREARHFTSELRPTGPPTIVEEGNQRTAARLERLRARYYGQTRPNRPRAVRLR